LILQRSVCPTTAMKSSSSVPQASVSPYGSCATGPPIVRTTAMSDWRSASSQVSALGKKSYLNLENNYTDWGLQMYYYSKEVPIIIVPTL